MLETHVVTSVRMTLDQHRQLKELAAREHRSISHQLRFMIERYIEDVYGQDVIDERQAA